MAIHFILQNMVNKILMKLKCFACKIERKFFSYNVYFPWGNQYFRILFDI